jgi:hypothetical protein
MNPTAALTESGIPATARANTPPVKAKGVVISTAHALGNDASAVYSRPKTTIAESGTMTDRRRIARC